MPAGIIVLDRIIQDVAVAVEGLTVVRELQNRISTQEPSKNRIVDASVHVDEADFVEHFMAGEATLGVGRIESRRIDPTPVGVIAAIAPGVKAEELDDGSLLVSYFADAAEVVGVHPEVFRGEACAVIIGIHHKDPGPGGSGDMHPGAHGAPLVYGFNHNKGEVIECEVIRDMQRSASSYTRLTIDGEVFGVT